MREAISAGVRVPMTWLGRRLVHALCETCGWESYAVNAQGNAARHARAHGHKVGVEIVQYLYYEGDT